MLVPVLFVFVLIVRPVLLVLARGANTIPVERTERRVPTAERLLIGHAGHLGREGRIVGRALQPDDRRQLELGGSLLHPAVRALRLEVAHPNRVARLGLQVVGRPVVEHDLAVPERADGLSIRGEERPQRRLAGEVDGGDGGVGDLAIPGSDGVGQVRERRLAPLVGQGLG